MSTSPKTVAIIGGGPAGLMAAQVLSQNPDITVDLYEHKPSVGRKFLIAGRGGLNLTHSSDIPEFISAYGVGAAFLERFLSEFTPQMLIDWAKDLGSETFVGSSGRIFPTEMKATKLMRSWTKRLTDQGVRVHLQHSLTDFKDNHQLTFQTKDGTTIAAEPDAILFAMGGASYPHLGSTGEWVNTFLKQGIKVRSLQPVNCGFESKWSDFLTSKFAGAPLKNIRILFEGAASHGDLIVTEYGLEGGAIYELSRELVTALNTNDNVQIHLDFCPGQSLEQVKARLDIPRQKQSLSNFLRKRLSLSALQIALLHEAERTLPDEVADLAKLIKNVPITLTSPRPIARAISSMGGITLEELTPELMLRQFPGYFAAGEMINWDAPTGGYLLQASFSTGYAAAHGIEKWLAAQD